MLQILWNNRIQCAAILLFAIGFSTLLLHRNLMKIEKEKIREIVIISLEENEISLIRIKGKIDPNQMQNIIEDNA